MEVTNAWMNLHLNHSELTRAACIPVSTPSSVRAFNSKRFRWRITSDGEQLKHFNSTLLWIFRIQNNRYFWNDWLTTEQDILIPCFKNCCCFFGKKMLFTWGKNNMTAPLVTRFFTFRHWSHKKSAERDLLYDRKKNILRSPFFPASNIHFTKYNRLRNGYKTPDNNFQIMESLHKIIECQSLNLISWGVFTNLFLFPFGKHSNIFLSGVSQICSPLIRRDNLVGFGLAGRTLWVVL